MDSIDDETTIPISGPENTSRDGPVTETTHTTGIEPIERGESLEPGEVVGEYEIEQKIGWGGCSTVYSAIRLANREPVAIKVMHPGLAQSNKQVQRFVQEARALQSIDHPTLVKVHSVGCTHDGRPFIVMELLDGLNLAALIHTRGRVAPATALEVLRPVCEALALAHASGIVHRDIKASNIIITEGERRVKLLDFGIAKLVNADSGAMQTTVGHVLGTPHSMAPEQIRGRRVDGRTDVYALGALLYRLLTGRHPFEGYDALALTRMHVHSPPPMPSESAPVSPQLDAVVRRAMAKEPRNRYDSVEAFIDALADAVGGQPAADSGGTRNSSRAIAIYVEGRVESGCDADDDQLLDDLMNVLEIAERAFRLHEFLVPLQTGNAILGAVLVDEQNKEDTVRMRVMDLAAEIEQTIATRPDADDRIDVNLCMHIDGASIRRAADPLEIVGGPIIDVGSWAPQKAMDGVCATQETLGFARDGREGSSRSYIRIGSRRTSRL